MTDRRLAALALSCLVTALLAAPASAATVVLQNLDGAGEGFNDPTPVAPIFGNAGTTLGQQRLNSFQAAANSWGQILDSSVTIRVKIQMDPLTCNPTSGLLGQAGPIKVFRDFPNAPRAQTWFPVALANARRGSDNDAGDADITATFNSRLDTDPNCLSQLAGWWYGVGAAVPADREDFFSVVLHELAHGLGFLSLVNPSSGERLDNFDDTYMVRLEDHSAGKTWPQLNNSQRAASAIDAGDLHWVGAKVVAAGSGLAAGRHPTGHIRMFAPNPVVGGSSVSHWDTVVAPDELMEPIANETMQNIVTTALLEDIGWQIHANTGACLRNASTACLVGDRFEVKVNFANAQTNGAAQIMSFGGQRAENNDSAFFFFTGSTNFEMGLKVLNACGLNGKFWVFIGGLTDQGWTVTVRDTQTGATKTYTNANGHLTSTVADTAALGCP